ncbi:hypothetical protein H1R81_04475 [Emticicia sp. BO119]|nr:hypothetical protein [Emticicia sp. BO119]
MEKSFSKSTELIYHVDKTRIILEIGKINSRQLIETLTNNKEFQGDRFGYTITIQSIELTLIPKAGNGA